MKVRKGTLRSKVMAVIKDKPVTIDQVSKLVRMDKKTTGRTMHALAYDGSLKNVAGKAGTAVYQRVKNAPKMTAHQRRKAAQGNSGKPIKVRKKYTRRNKTPGLMLLLETYETRLQAVEKFLGMP